MERVRASKWMCRLVLLVVLGEDDGALFVVGGCW